MKSYHMAEAALQCARAVKPGAKRKFAQSKTVLLEYGKRRHFRSFSTMTRTSPAANVLLRLVLAQYKLAPTGVHGVEHWERVEKLGLLLAKTSGADPAVITHFAYLHDSKRETEGPDPGHGERAADFAGQLHCDGLLKINDRQLRQLQVACRYHTKGLAAGTSDITILTCLDGDRLDLWRVAKEPAPDMLFTKEGKSRAMINYALKLGKKQNKPGREGTSAAFRGAEQLPIRVPAKSENRLPGKPP